MVRFRGPRLRLHPRRCRPVLAGNVFPHVTRLGLRNAELTDDIARALPASTIASRLVHLDLSMGTMTDAGAAALVAGARAFAT